jgi:dTDP-4-amino-4,6-dideoxygalactose transaminase
MSGFVGPKYKWPMFWPYIPDHTALLEELETTLASRWVGQGPKVDRFETRFAAQFDAAHAVAVNSCTAALHLAYILAGISPFDCVISPVFTCTATNHMLLQREAKILFADVEKGTLNINPKHVSWLLSRYPVKAIIGVHIGGDPCNITELLTLGAHYDIPVIFDAAQALGAVYNGTSICSDKNCGFATTFSFQAIKHITCGDGGMLCLPTGSLNLACRARHLRWFGIDRERRNKEFDWQPWMNRGITVDQYEPGFKYQMTDIAACFGLVGLTRINVVIEHRKKIASIYRKNLSRMHGITLLRDDSATPGWESSYSLFGMFVENRDEFCKTMASRGIETSVVQLRNDLYSVFGGKRQALSNMNEVEEKYIYIPVNPIITEEDAHEISSEILKGW